MAHLHPAAPAISAPAEVQIPEARAFYAFQSAIESVHSEMYGLLLEQYISDRVQRDMLFHAVDTIPCVRECAASGRPACAQRAGLPRCTACVHGTHPCPAQPCSHAATCLTCPPALPCRAAACREEGRLGDEVD